mmetsp:Transcript_28683/g.56347  ORF Transcript_28683/g.56347 Transcript_28683/m.56347 type:complete len:147 (+) Transcript_28683:1193-1633(+)
MKSIHCYNFRLFSVNFTASVNEILRINFNKGIKHMKLRCVQTISRLGLGCLLFETESPYQMLHRTCGVYEYNMIMALSQMRPPRAYYSVFLVASDFCTGSAGFDTASSPQLIAKDTMARRAPARNTHFAWLKTGTAGRISEEMRLG